MAIHDGSNVMKVHTAFADDPVLWAPKIDNLQIASKKLENYYSINSYNTCFNYGIITIIHYLGHFSCML